MPSRQAGEHDCQKQAALLYNLQCRICERAMFASMMQAAVLYATRPRVSEPATHITPLPFIEASRD
jgi:hypothetical protein